MLLFTLSLVLANIWTGLRCEVGRHAYDVPLMGLLSMMVRCLPCRFTRSGRRPDRAACGAQYPVLARKKP